MKEATGELNMTVITVVAIAAVAAFFYAFVWPRLKLSISDSQVCQNGPGFANTTAVAAEGDILCEDIATGATGKRTYKCTYYNAEKSAARSVTCNVK